MKTVTVTMDVFCKTCGQKVGIHTVVYNTVDGVETRDDKGYETLIPFKRTPGIGPQCIECTKKVGFTDIREFEKIRLRR